MRSSPDPALQDFIQAQCPFHSSPGNITKKYERDKPPLAWLPSQTLQGMVANCRGIAELELLFRNPGLCFHEHVLDILIW